MMFGIIIVFIGIILLMEVIVPGFNIEFNIIWPFLLIILGIYSLLKEKKLSLFGVIILFIGLWFLLNNLGYLPDQYKNMFWPICIILAGLFIAVDSMMNKKKPEEVAVKIVSDNTYRAVFSGIKEKILSKDFKSCNIDSIFGGVELDLSEIEINSDIVLNINSIFGGTNIILPKKYNIKVNSNSFMGGVDNKTKTSYDTKEKTIYINAVSVFGGTQLK